MEDRQRVFRGIRWSLWEFEEEHWEFEMEIWEICWGFWRSLRLKKGEKGEILKVSQIWGLQRRRGCLFFHRKATLVCVGSLISIYNKSPENWAKLNRFKSSIVTIHEKLELKPYNCLASGDFSRTTVDWFPSSMNLCSVIKILRFWQWSKPLKTLRKP
jgi:hypothetical protein